jgi:hypothetical protein
VAFKKTSFSIDPDLVARAKKHAKARAEKDGYVFSFSAYVAKLIRDDLAASGDMPTTIRHTAAKTAPKGHRVGGIARGREKSEPKK